MTVCRCKQRELTLCQNTTKIPNVRFLVEFCAEHIVGCLFIKAKVLLQSLPLSQTVPPSTGNPANSPHYPPAHSSNPPEQEGILHFAPHTRLQQPQCVWPTAFHHDGKWPNITTNTGVPHESTGVMSFIAKGHPVWPFDHFTRYGILYPKDPSAQVEKFIKIIDSYTTDYWNLNKM